MALGEDTRKFYDAVQNHRERRVYMDPAEIQEIACNPSYHRVKRVILHCYNSNDYPTDIPDLLIHSDFCGKAAILSVLSEYSKNGEDGWVCPMARALLGNQLLVIN